MDDALISESLASGQQLRRSGSLDPSCRDQMKKNKDGSCLIDVITAADMRVFIENKSLDLYSLQFKECPIGFDGCTMGGRNGVLTTDGIRSAPDPKAEGNGCADRIMRVQPEDQVIKTDEGEILEMTVRMNIPALSGQNLRFNRKIRILLSGSSIHWQDTVINPTSEPVSMFLLYDFNFGAPFLDPALQIYFPPGQVIPKTKESEKGLSEYNQMGEPIDGCPEQVFLHLPLPDSQVEKKVQLVRSDLQIALVLSWSSETLPFLVQRKRLKTGDYALGIQLAASQIERQARKGEDESFQELKPFDQKAYHLSLELLSLT